MTLKKLLFPLVLLLFLFAFSCARKKDCVTGGINLTFKGYDTTGVDSIKITSFTAGSDFTAPGSSFTLVLQEYNFLADSSIQLQRYCQWDENCGYLDAGHDWKIETPTKTLWIDDFTEKQLDQKCGGLLSLDCPACYDQVISCRVNGALTVLNGNNFLTIIK